LSRPEARIRLDDRALARFAAAPKRPSHRGFAPMLAFLSVFLVIAASAGRATRSLSASQPKEMQMKYPLSVMAAAAFATSAFGTDRLVPQQYPTIQAAVNASVNGDRVLISPGLYRESVNLDGKAVRLQGSDPELVSQTVLTGAGVVGGAVSAPTRTTYAGQVGLSDLTIDGLGAFEVNDDAGVFFGELGPLASLEVRHCVFRRTRTGSQNGGALFIAHTSTPPRVIDCVFRDNSSMNHGEAIYIYDGVHAFIERCVFDGHTIGSNVFYARTDAVMSVANCVIRDTNTLSFNHLTGALVFSHNVGCQMGPLTEGGYIDGGGNNWNGPCPDCDGDGVIDLEEMLFNNGDCNANGLLDACEIPSHPNWDRNHDGILDACQCIADISGNGSVDGVDLAAILAAWGSAGNGKTGTDIDGDGIVGGSDLAIVLGSWGPCP
jgi:hypothetical protein